MNSSYVALARLLDLPQHDEPEQEVVVQAVKAWLQQHQGWLLILDNADEPEAFFPPDSTGEPAQHSPFLPESPRGHILLTTRAADLTGLGLGIAHGVEVPSFAAEEGALFLLHRANLLASHASLEQADPQERLAALALSQGLGGLPLALDQAGAYMAASRTNPTSYVQLHQQHRVRLLRERRNRAYPDSVATTWTISFERVVGRNPAAADLLQFCAYLAADAIPESFITQGAPHLGPLLAPVAADPFLLNQAIEALRAYSLIQRDPRTQTLSVHRLVQAVLRDSLASEMDKQWKRRAVQAVIASSPDVKDVAQWNACEQWLPHAQVCAIWIKEEKVTLPGAADMLNKVGFYLYARSRYAEAEPVYRLVLEIIERQLGASHPEMASSLGDLALVYQMQGKYAKAEPLLERALSIHKQQLGSSHPVTARSMNNLALLYRMQGKYTKAEPLYRRALKINEQQLGPNHPYTGNCLNNLAMMYQRQGKYAKAEPLSRRVLQIDEQQFGPSHPSTAQSLDNLAAVYRGQGKYAEAEPLLRRALSIREELLGTDHPATAKSLSNLAALYQGQGKYAEAKLLCQRVLRIQEQQLGPDHPETVETLRNLARFQED